MQNNVKRENCDEIDHEPAAHVSLRYLFEFKHIFVLFNVRVALEPAENEIKVKEYFHDPAYYTENLSLLYGKWNEKYVCWARIRHQKEYPDIEDGLP